MDFTVQKRISSKVGSNAGIDGLFVNELGLISGAACLPRR